MKTIVHFTGNLLVECKNPDDVLHPAIDYLERAALDGCPVLLVHASINDKLHRSSKCRKIYTLVWRLAWGRTPSF